MAEEVTPHVHVLVICYPSHGHINPMLRLAKRIAAKGILVTCSSSSVIRDDLAATSGVSASDDDVAVGTSHIRFDFLDDPCDRTLLDLKDFVRHHETAGVRSKWLEWVNSLFKKSISFTKQPC
jgi:hypothetical protein